MDEKRIIEIGGIKLEVDLRHATQVQSYHVGDNVKVLKKKYSDEYTSCPGVIIGFDNFQNLPTIVIAYMEVTYSTAELKIEYLNSASKNVEICAMIGDELAIDKQRALDLLDTAMERKKQELDDLQAKKNYFIENFKRMLLP